MSRRDALRLMHQQIASVEKKEDHAVVKTSWRLTFAEVNMQYECHKVDIPARSTERPTPRASGAPWVIGNVLHPFLVGPMTVILLLWFDQGSLGEALAWAGLCSCFVVLPALLYLRQKLRTRAFSDADVSVRGERHGFYAFGGMCMAACVACLFLLHAPRILLAGGAAGIVALLVAATINRAWTKVSIHAGALAGATAALAFFSWPVAGIFGFFTLVVCWARWKAGHHTPLQLVLGATIAVVSVLGAFATIGRL